MEGTRIRLTKAEALATLRELAEKEQPQDDDIFIADIIREFDCSHSSASRKVEKWLQKGILEEIFPKALVGGARKRRFRLIDEMEGNDDGRTGEV